MQAVPEVLASKKLPEFRKEPVKAIARTKRRAQVTLEGRYS